MYYERPSLIGADIPHWQFSVYKINEQQKPLKFAYCLSINLQLQFILISKLHFKFCFFHLTLWGIRHCSRCVASILPILGFDRGVSQITHFWQKILNLEYNLQVWFKVCDLNCQSRLDSNLKSYLWGILLAKMFQAA